MPTSTHTDRGFMRERINAIGSALFFSDNNAVLKFPATIVTALEVDELGQVWFFLNRPTQSLQEFDRAFPARLDFYRKGQPYFLQVKGRAFIVSDPEEINQLAALPEDIRRKAMHEQVLVGFKIARADYFCSQPQKKAFRWKSVFSRISRSLFPARPEYRPQYNLEME